MAAPLKLFINQSANDAGDALVSSFTSASAASAITLTEGDRAREVEIHPLLENPSDDGRHPFTYDNPTGWSVKLAAGDIDAPVTSGTFTLTDTAAGQTTGPISKDATGADIQAAVRAALTTRFANAVCTGNAGGPWILDRGTTGYFVGELTADTSGISPRGSTLEIALTQNGDSLLHHVWELTLSAAPAILNTDGWSPLPAAAASVTTATEGGSTANERQRVRWNADAYAGSVSLSLALPHVVSIASSSIGNPAIITTSVAHGLQTGESVTISGHSGSSPSINSTYTVTRISDTKFSVPVNVTLGGTGGTLSATLTRGIGPIPHDADETTFVGLLAEHPASSAGKDSFAVTRNGAGDYMVTFKGALANLAIAEMTATHDLKVPVGLKGTINCLTAGVRRLLNGSRVPITTNLEIEKTVAGFPTTIAFRSDLRIRPELISSTPGSSDPQQGFVSYDVETGALSQPSAQVFRDANGIAPAIEVVETATNLAITDAHNRKVVSNYGASEYIDLTASASPGTEVVIVNEQVGGFGISLIATDKPFLAGGVEYTGALESWTIGNFCRLLRTNRYWLILAADGFGPAA